MDATPILQGGIILAPADRRGLVDLSKFLVRHTEHVALLGLDGEQVPLPAEVYAVLIRVIDAMSEQRAVALAPVAQRLTTQEAADLLGISRSTLIKLIDDGTLSCEKPAVSRHRRLRLTDVLEYQERRNVLRDELLTKLVRNAEKRPL